MVYMGELYNRYMPLVYGVCLKYLKNSTNAQDAVMHIFEELLTKILNHSVQNFKSWLYVLAKNHCLMQLRSTTKNKEVSIDGEFMEFADEFHLDKVMEDEFKAKALEDCISKLTNEQKVSITQFYIENLSYIEICEATGYNTNNVKSYIQNGKRNLKLCLERKGIKSATVEHEVTKQ